MSFSTPALAPHTRGWYPLTPGTVRGLPWLRPANPSPRPLLWPLFFSPANLLYQFWDPAGHGTRSVLRGHGHLLSCSLKWGHCLESGRGYTWTLVKLSEPVLSLDSPTGAQVCPVTGLKASLGLRTAFP